jgi:serine/threonine protein kinase/Tfp pilus assembly protein PilF
MAAPGLVFPADEILAGRLFAGRYQIIEELGRGGMGRVYKAFDTEIREKVALKLIQPFIAGDVEVLVRFKQELKQARRVSHRNVCRMFDLGESEGAHFLTMEYCPGEPLKSMLRMTGRLDPAAAVDYARQIAAGLVEAHRLGIIHRDLKPHNIMIEPDGTAKIMDFGIARSIVSGGLTERGAAVGTPEYMAPEQAAGEAVDARADIYALGVILYEMVTGHTPFRAESAVGVALKHKTEPPRPPTDAVPGLPPALNQLILKCLEKDPGRRYPSAEALRSELVSLAASLGHPSAAAEAPLPTIRIREKPWTRLRPWILSALLLIGAAVVLRLVLAPRGHAEGLSEGEGKLAFLPLVDSSPGQDAKILGDGMTADLRTKLSKTASLKLIAASSRISVSPGTDSLTQIGRSLKARYVVSGSLNSSDNNLSVSIQVGDSVLGKNILENTYEAPISRYFETEDRIVAEIVAAIRSFVSNEGMAAAKKREPSNLEAFRDYRLGRFFENRYRESKNLQDFRDAEKSFRDALAHDQRYALAYCGLGDLYEARFVDLDQFPDVLAMQRFYKEAADLDPAIAETQVGLGWSYFYQEDQEQACLHFTDAYKMDPGNPQVTLGTGAFLRSIGLYDKALKYLSETMILEPEDVGPVYQYASCLFYLGRPQEALEALRETLKLEPESARPRIFMARISLSLGRPEESQTSLDAAMAKTGSPGSIRNAARRLEIWLAAARRDKAKALSLVPSVDRPYAYEIVNAYCLLDLRAEAIQAIQYGRENGFRSVKDYLYSYLYLINNPLFHVLKGEKMFKEIVEQEKSRFENLSRTARRL